MQSDDLGTGYNRRRACYPSHNVRIIIRIALGLVAVVALIAAGAYLGRTHLQRMQLELPAFSHSSGDVKEEQVRMRDGIRLATTVFQPAGDGPWPTILIRNPYDAGLFIRGWCELFVRYGYACVYQRVRGQIDSEGEWEPMVHELDDGEDTLAWLVKQRFQDGNIGFYGPSYLASVQWAMAARGLPPEVKTMVPMVYGTDQYRLVYERGMFRHEIFTSWAAVMPGRGFARENSDLYPKLVRHRPHIEIDERFLGVRLPWYRSWVSNPSAGDPLWQSADLAELTAAPARTQIPVLMIGGWYDIFLATQFEDWRHLGSRARSKYVIGPWTHLQTTAGDLDLPDGRGRAYQWQLVLDWMNHHLKGEELEQPRGAVESYVIGEDRWVSREAWPPPTRLQRLHLSGLRDAHGCDGGSLSAATEADTETVSYRYDPDDPVPMRGGAGSLAFILADGGPVHSVLQNGLCERADVLSFATEVLESKLHIAGSLRVVLSVSSDAPDTSFTAKLVEVKPDGRAFNIRDSITRLAYRDQLDAPQSYHPGTVVPITIEMWPIEWVVPAGSRLRLDVSSSNFPAYHAHTNRAGPWAQQKDAITAQQTLYAGAAHEAYLELPVAFE